MAPRWPGPRRFPQTRQAADTRPVVLRVNANTGRTTGGLSVTVTGRNFVSAATGAAPVVTFVIGGLTFTATAIALVDSQHLTCTVPASTLAGLADVTVTCGTQSGTLFGAFTYFTSTITRVLPRFGGIVGGTVVRVEGYNFLDGSLVFFDDDLADNIVVVDSRHITCTAPAHIAGFVTIYVQEPEI